MASEEPPYNPDFWKCPTCDFAVQPPAQVNPKAAQACTNKLFAHLRLPSSACLDQAGYESLEAFKKVN